jgi:hypothetical protein
MVIRHSKEFFNIHTKAMGDIYINSYFKIEIITVISENVTGHVALSSTVVYEQEPATFSIISFWASFRDSVFFLTVNGNG